MKKKIFKINKNTTYKPKNITNKLEVLVELSKLGWPINDGTLHKDYTNLGIDDELTCIVGIRNASSNEYVDRKAFIKLLKECNRSISIDFNSENDAIISKGIVTIGYTVVTHNKVKEINAAINQYNKAK